MVHLLFGTEQWQVFLRHLWVIIHGEQLFLVSYMNSRFATYNYLQANMPTFGSEMKHKLARNALIGFSASVTSDCISNSVRVVKTYRQTHPERVSYSQAVKEVVAKDGLVGLFGRGLKTRLAANGIQGILFSVMWKFFEEKLNKN